MPAEEDSPARRKFLGTISRSSLVDAKPNKPASITNVKYLSSYDWIEAKDPTIVVPGSPSDWTPPRFSRQLKKDSGFVYSAQNAALHPDYPLEPLFRSVFHMDPSFDFNTVDIITDRNNIRKLLSYIKPTIGSHAPEGFTILIEVIGNTTIFCRDEEKTEEFIGLNEFRGYGFNFEKAYTSSPIRDSIGHFRVISYDFCGLKFVVRHKSEAYIKPAGHRIPAREKVEPESLSEMMGSLALSSSEDSSSTTSFPGSKLKLREGGKAVPLESTIEIKTRSHRKPLAFSDVAAQVWVSQTPKLVRALHDRGRFQNVEVESIDSQIKDWESSHESDLKKLFRLVQLITSIVKVGGGKAKLVYDAERDDLQLQTETEKSLLPKDLYKRWGKKTSKNAHHEKK